MVSTTNNQFRPEKIDQDNLKICDDFIIPLKVIGCELSADETLQELDILENDGFPLTRIASLLVGLDILDRDRDRTIYFLPMSRHVIKLIDNICCARLIDNADKRIKKFKAELCSLISDAIQQSQKNIQMANQIINTIFSYTHEFQIACILHASYPLLKFNTKGGPDFILEDGLGIKVEAKSKLNRKYLGNLSSPSITLDKNTLLKLLSKDVFEAAIAIRISSLEVRCL